MSFLKIFGFKQFGGGTYVKFSESFIENRDIILNIKIFLDFPESLLKSRIIDAQLKINEEELGKFYLKTSLK